MSNANALDALFAPTSVAVIGASDDATRIGGRPLRYLIEAGFPGKVYPVNPRRTEVQGLRAYPDVGAIEGPVDLAIVIVSAEQSVGAVQACAAKGVRSVIIFSAGFAEVGPEGLARQAEITAIARRSGMRVLGPNCLGAFNATLGFFGTFTQAFDKGVIGPGPLAVVSQSGAAGGHLAYLCRKRGIGIGHWVTTGNEADIELSECLQWMAEASQVKVIAVFAEAIRDGAAFVRALETARRHRKPVIMVKVGRSDAGARAAASHTGALVGEDKVYDAVLRQYGAHRADSIDELLDLAYACGQGRYPDNRRLGIVTTSGGLGILSADVAAQQDLDVVPLPQAVRDKITAMVPYAGTSNPIDVTAQGVNDPSLIARCIELAVVEGGYGALFCFLTSAPAAPSIGVPLFKALKAMRMAHPQVLIALEMAAPPEIVMEYEEAGFLVFEDLNRAIRTVATLARFRASFERPSPLPLPSPTTGRLPAAIDEHSAKAVLAACGIRMLPERLVRDGAAAHAAAREIGCPVVLKIVSPDLPHKTEVGGVCLGVASAHAAQRETEAMLAHIAKSHPKARIHGVLVAPMLEGGVETICGAFTDPVFGPIVMFGLGGIHVEILRDVAFRLAPFDIAEAHRMVME
ncbi:MAG: acetate--CoA ligase family protein, partial [Burkholderiaceae bacterium]|nr:acetate--CoA ligase family protein [Burkholderiaceae bacterium]